MTETELPSPQAYVAIDGKRAQPLCADVLEELAEPGWVRVRLHYPDEHVASPHCVVTRGELLGYWYERPSQQAWPGYQNDLTWAQLAEQTYRHVLAQRQLAERLTKLGIPRPGQHYAGMGGTESGDWGGHEGDLHLGHEELDRLLTFAEAGPVDRLLLDLESRPDNG